MRKTNKKREKHSQRGSLSKQVRGNSRKPGTRSQSVKRDLEFDFCELPTSPDQLTVPDARNIARDRPNESAETHLRDDFYAKEAQPYRDDISHSMSPYPENNLPHLEDSDMAKELVRYAYGLIASDTEDSKSRFPRFESEDGLASPQQRYTNEDLHRLFTATDDKTDHFCAWGKGLSRKCGELQKLCFEEINRNKGLYQAFKNLHTAKSLENTTLEAKISELRKSHIKSVNSVDAGTEPISDQELEDSVRRLHDEVNGWCRSAYKVNDHPPSIQLEYIHNLGSNPFLMARVDNKTNFKTASILEAVVWEYIEEEVLSPWLVGLAPDVQYHMRMIEKDIRNSREDCEKANYWRSYTASLLSQSPQVKAELEKGLNKQSKGLHKCLDELGLHFMANVYTNEEYKKISRGILTFIRFARSLAVQLRCQRGQYEVDHKIALGDRYDEEFMDDLTFADLDGKEAVVSCIISKRIVKRSSGGLNTIVSQLCKARVLATVI